ncbi:MAG: iron export ABC transporter permease subunit FetB [Oscillatoriales cyanobacterium C42_A2020_001]|nr:iron export ABC transporter permease subunit FetB [Leptolyngbyaceae cyanobacterium C42_A2020_001]
MDSPLQLVWALGLMAIAIALSAWQRLELEWSLALATGRTVLQLLVVGYVLAAVFAFKNPLLILGLLAIMLAIAAIVARNRISKKVPNLLAIVGGAMAMGTLLTLVYTMIFVIQPPTWYEPQFLIPLAGIVLGNAMNGAAISGERLVSTLNSSQLEIETHLSLGATPRQAIAQYRKDAVKAGLIPTINTMMVVGLVTLPGIMTGQLLSGVPPLVATSYQMVIMFMLAFATLITTLLVTSGICRQYFNPAGQLTPW